MADYPAASVNECAPDTMAGLAALRALAPLDDEVLAAFAALVTRREFSPQTYLLEAGVHAEWCHLLRHGLVREFYIDADGIEHTRVFVCEGQLTGSLFDLLSGAPAITWIQTLEATSTLAFRYADYEALCERYPALHVVSRRVAERLYLNKIRREHDMLALSARERHARWLAEEPMLDARISRRHLASYLGITPEHLSRLCRRERAPLPVS